MIEESYSITGGDYETAGLASSRLKERLKKIGLEPSLMRRIMIAAYEAEMNVVIHAVRGTMRVILRDRHLDMEVLDEGPGIKDIPLAMQRGYSTAPRIAREMGFGAGMGLPHIQKSSDFFRIESVVGSGTSVRIKINLKTQEDASNRTSSSLTVKAELCRKCLRCLHPCPTRAIRLHGDRPIVLGHLCIDCTACIQVCPSGVFTIDCESSVPTPPEGAVLVVPASLFFQFERGTGTEQVAAALGALGFQRIVSIEGWESALRDAVSGYAGKPATPLPVISPVCPAIVTLIETRFPSLIPYLAPFLSPAEAALRELAPPAPFLMVACPSQAAAVRSGSSKTEPKIVSPDAVIRAILPLLSGTIARCNLTMTYGPGATFPLREASPLQELSGNSKVVKILTVSGVLPVIRVLEQVENGILKDVPILEPFACQGGCFGSPLMREDPCIARYRRDRWPHVPFTPATAVPREAPYRVRSGLRLHTDMGEAIARLSRIDRLIRELPGRNCGVCGAPTCEALAEDVVLGRASKSDCAFLEKSEGKPPCN